MAFDSVFRLLRTAHREMTSRPSCSRSSSSPGLGGREIRCRGDRQGVYHTRVVRRVDCRSRDLHFRTSSAWHRRIRASVSAPALLSANDHLLYAQALAAPDEHATPRISSMQCKVRSRRRQLISAPACSSRPARATQRAPRFGISWPPSRATRLRPAPRFSPCGSDCPTRATTTKPGRSIGNSTRPIHRAPTPRMLDSAPR